MDRINVLQTPKRRNQKQESEWHPIFRKSRKRSDSYRIETLFSQLWDQMMLKSNYSKTINGLNTRLISKIAALTILQYVNYQQNKPINHFKIRSGFLIAQRVK